jgi:predicted deacylase
VRFLIIPAHPPSPPAHLPAQLYVRADMNDPVASRLAKLQAPQVIVHNTGPDGSLRGAAVALGKPSVTVEIGNPQVLQAGYVDKALAGVLATMGHLKMTPPPPAAHGGGGGSGSGGDAAAPLPSPTSPPPVVCARSFWLFTETGGLLYVFPAVATWVRRGDVVAEIHSVYGALVDRIVAPQDAVVVGKSTNPVAESGDRILHLGVVEPAFPAKAEDGHM